MNKELRAIQDERDIFLPKGIRMAYGQNKEGEEICYIHSEDIKKVVELNTKGELH